MRKTVLLFLYAKFEKEDKVMDYHSGKWKAKRKKILRRDGYMCQYCRRFGKRVDAVTVHHIYPAEKYPQYIWCDWNLISLCGQCHDKMHDRTNNMLTVDGDLLKRLADRRKRAAPML